MQSDDRTHQLLEEIRDAQREHLAEYRRATGEALALQRNAVQRQEQINAIYKRMVLIGGVVTIMLVGLLVYLLARWSDYLFR